ncbi:MAG: thioester reductase domain-containing protein [Microthrixaceae bacterium]
MSTDPMSTDPNTNEMRIADPMERFMAMAASDAQIAGMFPDAQVAAAATTAFDDGLEHMIDTILEGYAEREAIAERAYDVETDTETGRTHRSYRSAFEAITYVNLQERCRNIASAWRHEPDLAVAPDDNVAVIGFAGADYATLHLAAIYAQAVFVPLASSTAGADLGQIFERTNPAAIGATISDLLLAAECCVAHGNVRSLIAFDYDARVSEDVEAFAEAERTLRTGGVETRLVTLDDVVERGARHEFSFLPEHPEGPEKLCIIMHSSGATGVPKGAMITTFGWSSLWKGDDQAPQITVGFAPFNHGMGLGGLAAQLRKGSLTYMTLRPDMSTLFEDIRIARPTFLAFFPRVFELIHQHFLNEVAQRVRAGADQGDAEQAVMAEMRSTFLGDRLTMSLVGSAPTSEEVQTFIRECFQILLVEAYSNTESGGTGIAIDGKIDRRGVEDYYLRDVPELGYYSSDKPNPRGELCYKTRTQIKGYYKDPEATADLLTDDGYIATGDIVELIGPDTIAIIDRRKDVIKLSQAEYVAVGPLAATFEGASPAIHQMYLYGNSHRSYLLAVIVPDSDILQGELGPEATDAAIDAHLRAELARVGAAHDLKSFEIPRDFILESEPFSQENGLLSAVRKRLRPALNAKYAERLEAIYQAHDEELNAELVALKDPSNTAPTIDKLATLVKIHLGLDHVSLDTAETYHELGGDSLGAVELSMAIEEIFGVDMPADGILGPTGTLARIARDIDSARTGVDRPTFDRVHGTEPSEFHAADLALATFLDQATIDSARSLPEATSPAEVVLLTGANGFLGRETCLQWMTRVAPAGGKVLCIVRADDDEGAAARLRSAFADASPAYLARFDQLAGSHLEVLAGDLGQTGLGLDADTFERLASQVHRICHVGALVNHRLAYKHLFGPNVAGTAELIRLAATQTRKPIDFVSTMGTAMLQAPGVDDFETALPQPTVPHLEDIYGAGYATSKWACEHLLVNAANELGLTVTTLRGPMMLPHREIPGVINTGDMFTRLLYSIVVTGIAPSTFHTRNDDGSPVVGHYQGMPVDTVAASVVAASDIDPTTAPGYRAVNVTNYHHDDGASLDAFMDWTETAGVALQRIDDYQDWLAAFAAKLETLAGEQRSHSAIDVLGAYARPTNPAADRGVLCERYRALIVPHLPAGVPSLDEKYLHKCIDDLSVTGMLTGSRPSVTA